MYNALLIVWGAAVMAVAVMAAARLYQTDKDLDLIFRLMQEAENAKIRNRHKVQRERCNASNASNGGQCRL